MTLKLSFEFLIGVKSVQNNRVRNFSVRAWVEILMRSDNEGTGRWREAALHSSQSPEARAGGKAGRLEMEQYLAASGFKDYQPEVTGSILTFSAREQAA